MPRTRSKTKTASGSANSRVTYKECDSSSEHEGNMSDDAAAASEMFTSLLGLFVQRRSASRRRTSAGRTPKKRRRAGNLVGECTGQCSGHARGRGRGAGRSSARAKKGKATQTKTAAIPDTSIDLGLDSDDEVIDKSVTATQSDKIMGKMDSFFKALESDDEEVDESVEIPKASTVPPEKKTKTFYTLLSDSDEEKKDTPRVSSTVTHITPVQSPDKPSTSSTLTDTLSTGLKMVTSNLNIDTEKKREDIFAYVDEILNECNEVVDLTDNKTKESISAVLSMEDLKKKTDEILGGVAMLIDDMNPKPKEPEKKPVESPQKEAPICPVCLEQLGGSRQAMATMCGHLFCEACLLKVVQTTKKCPSCRKGVTKNKYHPVYI